MAGADVRRCLLLAWAFDLRDQGAQQFGSVGLVAAVEPTAVLGQKARKVLKRLPHTTSDSNAPAAEP